MSSQTFLACTTAALLASISCAGPQNARSHEPAEAGARRAAAQIETGWNTKQAALFAAPFAPDSDFVAITGYAARGRAAIEAAHRELFAGRYRESTIALEVERVRVLRPGVAFARIRGHNTTTFEGRTAEWDVVISLVMIEDGGAWTIASFHNTRVEPPPGAPRAGGSS